MRVPTLLVVLAVSSSALVTAGPPAPGPEWFAAHRAALAGARAPAKREPVRMHVGCQRRANTAEQFRFFKRHGVEHVVGYPDFPKERGYFNADEVQKLRELGAQHGVAVDTGRDGR